MKSRQILVSATAAVALALPAGQLYVARTAGVGFCLTASVTAKCSLSSTSVVAFRSLGSGGDERPWGSRS